MSLRTDIEQALIDRGVNRGLADVLVTELGTDNVQRTIAWFDEQGGRVGAGVLVAELRAGGRPGASEPIAMPCPCTPELQSQWDEALERFPDTFAGDVARSWAQHCHPHRHDAAGWALGADRSVTGWITRYLPAIRRGVGEQVSVQRCASLRPSEGVGGGLDGVGAGAKGTRG